MMNLSHTKYPLHLAAAGLGIGLAADLMFYRQPLGISVPLVMGLLLAALYGLALHEGRHITWANAWFGAAALLLAALSMVRDAAYLRTLDITGALVLLLLQLRALTAPSFEKLNLGGYALSVLEGVAVAVAPIWMLINMAERLRQADPARRQLARRVMVGVGLSLPLLLIFTALFASADLVFDNMLRRTFAFFRPEYLIGHIFLTAFLTWIAAGCLTYALSRPESAPGTQPAIPENEQPQQRWRFLGTLEASIVLFSVDALFGLFVGVQFAALFGGAAFLEQQGITYSAYARRGFFELVTAAVIVLSLILVLDFFTRRETRRQKAAFMVGAVLIIGMTVIMLISAFQRMALYEAAFGFTRLRVLTHIFMVWLALVLLVFLWHLLRQRTALFASSALIAVFAFVITLNVFNPDAYITRQNIARYEAGLELDEAYLGGLSFDAVPELIPLLEDPETEALIGPWLRAHQLRLDARQAASGWPAYHVSAAQAHRLLDARREVIEAYSPAFPDVLENIDQELEYER